MIKTNKNDFYSWNIIHFNILLQNELAASICTYMYVIKENEKHLHPKMENKNGTQITNQIDN